MTADPTAEPHEGLTLRDRARGAVREEVMRQAWDLFLRQGFEATTVDEIAEAAGMSRRTFFRYFAGKDELVLERLLVAGAEIAAALEARPSDEAAWPALRAAFDATVAVQEHYADRSRPLHLMLRDEPPLRASILERRRRWEELLVPLVALRLGPGVTVVDDPRPQAVTGAALACLEAAQELWAEGAERSLGDLLDDAMNAVRPLP